MVTLSQPALVRCGRFHGRKKACPCLEILWETTVHEMLLNPVRCFSWQENRVRFVFYHARRCALMQGSSLHTPATLPAAVTGG